jgi:hypothetical protein
MILAVISGRIKKQNGGTNEKAFFDRYSDGFNYLDQLD